MHFFNSPTLAGGFFSSSSLKPGMPSSSKMSSVTPSGASCFAARKAERLYDCRRRLPAMPQMVIGLLILFSVCRGFALDSKNWLIVADELFILRDLKSPSAEKIVFTNSVSFLRSIFGRRRLLEQAVEVQCSREHGQGAI